MRERKAFLLRLPPELHAQLRAWADQEMRSLNAQIEFLLRQAMRARRGSSAADAAADAAAADTPDDSADDSAAKELDPPSDPQQS